MYQEYGTATYPKPTETNGETSNSIMIPSNSWETAHTLMLHMTLKERMEQHFHSPLLGDDYGQGTASRGIVGNTLEGLYYPTEHQTNVFFVLGK